MKALCQCVCPPVFGCSSATLRAQEHNSKRDQTHSLTINRFADWHREEFLATMLPNHGKPRPALPLEGKQAVVHKPRVPEHMLPTTVDWRGSGADSPVKDQASCGSCWVSCGSSSCPSTDVESAQVTLSKDRRDSAGKHFARAFCGDLKLPFVLFLLLFVCPPVQNQGDIPQRHVQEANGWRWILLSMQQELSSCCRCWLSCERPVSSSSR